MDYIYPISFLVAVSGEAFSDANSIRFLVLLAFHSHLSFTLILMNNERSLYSQTVSKEGENAPTTSVKGRELRDIMKYLRTQIRLQYAFFQEHPSGLIMNNFYNLCP